MAKKISEYFHKIWKFVAKGGGLLSDFDPKEVPNGGLFVSSAETGALNIRNIGKGLGVSMSAEPIYGNTYQYTPDVVTVQDKTWRLYVTISGATIGNDVELTFSVTSPTGTQFVAPIQVLISPITSISNALSQIDNELTLAFAALTPTITNTVTGTYTGYIDFTFAEAPNFNYITSIVVDTGVMEVELVVTQEAIDVSQVGNWHMIGSDNRIGDTFQFWTTRTALPVEVPIFTITNPSGNIIQVTTTTDHGLVDGQAVRISGVVGTVEANGEWVIENVTATTFELVLGVYVSAYISGGTVSGNIYGLGEIGVAVLENDNTITYTRLLRSNEFNFVTSKQIDARSKRKQDSKIALYFVDNLNQYRVFYYLGAYITDGAVTTVSDDGQYSYGSIDIDLQLFISNEGFGITFVSQAQTGGSVKSGNWRYAVRFLTNELAPSEWSQITDTVSVFTANTEGSAYLLLGDEANIVTPKTNSLQITNAVPGLYSFYEVAAINYVDGSYTGVILARNVLDGNPTQDFIHTGNENSLTDLDIGEIGRIIPGIQTGRNIEMLDNRLVISNLTPQQVIDFTEWVETFKYSLERTALDPIGVYVEARDQFNVGEYQEPITIYGKKSHMIYEQYRYGFRFRMKGSGQLSPVFYPGYDIRIDLPATLPTERIAGTFTTFDLTDIAGPPTEVYSIYINWLNINLSYLIDGVPAYELISEIIPCRTDVIPEVLASGVSVLGVSGLVTDGAAFNFAYGVTPLDYIGPFPYFSGFANTTPTFAPGANPTYPQQTVGAPYNDPERDSVFFFSPDISFGLTSITYRSGDQLISFGNPVRHDVDNNVLPAGAIAESSYGEFNGYSNISANPTAQVINDALQASNGAQLVVVDGKNHSLHGALEVSGALDFICSVDNCVVIGLNASLANTGPNTDYGFYRSIYYRPLVDKYGDARTSIYTEMQTPYVIGSTTGVIQSGEILSYGDCFTEKTYVKHRNPAYLAGTTTATGFGSAVGYYSQNRNNLQLRRKPTPTYNASAIIPNMSFDVWLAENINSAIYSDIYIGGRDAQFFYNIGYTPRNQVTTAIAFDSTANYQRDWGNAIMWSNSEIDGSNTDYLRIFPPLNLKFLDYTFGPITDARDVNGDLVTVQHSRVERQYFNTTETLTSNDSSEIILGSSGVMNRKGQVVTKFGSQHKWSVQLGKSDKGFDVLYFIDANNKTACRYGYNGNDAIDEINGMKTFFANWLTWVRGKDTPAHDQGIHGINNQRYRELMWTFVGWKDVDDWIRNDVSDNLINGFEANFGDELIVNGVFGGTLNGWTPLNNAYAPAASWVLDYSTTQQIYFASHDTPAGYLAQTDTISLTPGTVYYVNIRVLFSDAPIEVSFQNGGPVAYTLATSGNYYFAYVAQASDDNIYLHQDASDVGMVTFVSMREILSTFEWDGGADWIIDPGGATATGAGTTSLTQTVASYLQPINYQLTYVVENRTAGSVTANIGNQADTPRSTNDTFTFSATPTTNGVVSFTRDAAFDGRITSSLILISDNAHDYVIGDVVQVPGTETFNETPDIYIALADNSNSYPTPVNTDWELIPHTNGDYYSEFTIIFAELFDKWQSFLSIKPKIYAEFANGYLVPRPIGDTGRVYLADSGIPTSWFFSDDGVQTADAYFDAVINEPIGRKRFLKVRMESDIAPDSMRVTTPGQYTLVPNARFLERPTGEFDAPVMNDATSTGVSDGDSSTLYGDWAIFRFTIAATTYNKINNFIATVRSLARRFNT